MFIKLVVLTELIIFNRTPLILEVLHRKKGGQEQLVGTARINLFQVLDARSVNHVVSNNYL